MRIIGDLIVVANVKMLSSENIANLFCDELSAEISCWIYSSERQLACMRLEFLRSLLNQEVGDFDTELTTATIMTGVTNHMSVIQDAIGEKVMVAAMHNTNVRFCCQTSTKLTSLQLGHFVASFSTFFAATIIAFISCWEVAMLSFLVIPLILFIGATYTKKMNGISLSRITTISEAISVVEQVLLYQLTSIPQAKLPKQVEGLQYR
jgi:ATP-binding cassette, subfamily B (MDR/TAP), member 1